MASGMIPNDLAKVCYMKGTYSVTNNPVFGRVGLGENNKQRITIYAMPTKSIAMANNITVTSAESVVLFGSVSGYKNIGSVTSDIVNSGMRGSYIFCASDRTTYNLTNNEILVGTATITFTVS